MDQINKLIAQRSFTLEGPGIVPGDTVSQTEKIISGVIGVLTVVSFVFFLIQVIFSGYAFISAQGDPKKIEVARKRLTDGILGITIVVVAYGVVAFIAKLVGLQNVFDLNSVINTLKFQ